MKNYLFLLLFILSSCGGYTPIYSEKKINFYFNKVNTEENNLANNKIIKKMSNFRVNKNNQIPVDINLESFFKKEVTSKDKKKNPNSFKITLNVKVNIKEKNNKTFDLKYAENFNYSKSDRSEFELIQYEEVIMNNLINSTFDKLIRDIVSRI